MDLIKNKVQNMQNMVTNLRMTDTVNVLIALLGLVLVLRTVCPFIMRAELFAETEAAASEAEYALPEDPLAAPALEDGQLGPVYDTKKQLIMDGRGMQVGPVDDAEQEGSVLGVDALAENTYFLDDGADGKMSIQHNMCSRSCCSDSQYPTPFKLKADSNICAMKKAGTLGTSNLFCNNAFQDSGCLCITKKQSQGIYNRMGNGRGFY
jgi:hypothetical protein